MAKKLWGRGSGCFFVNSKNNGKMSEKEKENQTPEEEQMNEQVITEQEEAPEKQPGEEAAPETGEDLESGYKRLKSDYDELKDKYLRLFAEFDNFKKRTIREKMDMMKNAAQDTMSELLPVLDDFDRAKSNASQEDSAETFGEGVGLVYNKLYTTLKRLGLEQMESNGERFDPELHEAITEIPAPAEDLKGHVLDTVEKGYKLNGKIIRHAKVVVGK